MNIKTSGIFTNIHAYHQYSIYASRLRLTALYKSALYCIVLYHHT